jgi:F0F1-type ATP synthase alpha subunit
MFSKIFKNIGIIESVGDGIINILGLQNASNGEMVEILFAYLRDNKFKTQKALILNLGPK